MYNLRDVVAAMAVVLVLPRASVETYVRRLQDQGVIPKGRARQAAEVDAEQVLALLLAVLTGHTAGNAAETVETYAGLRGPGIDFGNELLRLFRLAGRLPAGELDAVIEMSTSWASATVTTNGADTHFVDLAPIAPRPAFERRVRIDGRTLQRLAHHLNENHR